MRDKKFRHKACLECGCEFHSARKDAQFCSTTCRMDFNNRRKERGAELYDIMMMVRHERGFAKIHQLWSVATRMLQYWREDDVAKRGGRRSWGKPDEVLDSTAWARATVVNRNAAGVRR